MLAILQRDKTWIAPLAALAGALGLAVTGALLTGPVIGTVTGSVEAASAGSGSILSRVSELFSLGFAFSAGMVSSVNPCGFVMLPAYMGLYMGDDGHEARLRSFPARFQHAVLVGSTVTAGFLMLFAVVGMPIGLGAGRIVAAFPWIGLTVGVLLAAVGAYVLAGGKLYNGWAARIAGRLGDPTKGGFRNYFVFGIAYGIASLSCTLPVFLAVVGGAFTSGNFIGSLLQFLLYGFGMGAVVLAITIAMAAFKTVTVRTVHSLLPRMGIISAGLLLASGAFIVYYWLTIGGLLSST